MGSRTNLALPAGGATLVPNHGLRSSIQEFLVFRYRRLFHAKRPAPVWAYGDWPAGSFPETAGRVLKPSRISEKSSQLQPSGFSTATLCINSQSHLQQKIHPLLVYDGWYLENRNGFTKRAATICLGSPFPMQQDAVKLVVQVPRPKIIDVAVIFRRNACGRKAHVSVQNQITRNI